MNDSRTSFMLADLSATTKIVHDGADILTMLVEREVKLIFVVLLRKLMSTTDILLYTSTEMKYYPDKHVKVKCCSIPHCYASRVEMSPLRRQNRNHD